MSIVSVAKQKGEVLHMATSSIFVDVNISGKKKVEAFLAALENSAKHANKQPDCSGRLVTDPREIRRLFGKAK